MENTTVLATKRDFNPFTLALKARCEAEGDVMVGLRDGTFCQVVFRPANEAECTEDAFHRPDHSGYWEPSGHSVTSARFDIVKLAMPAATAVGANFPDQDGVADARFRQACWLALRFTVGRYLMSNAKGRWDGAEKAQRHIELCTFYVAAHRGIELEDVRVDHEQAYKAVHRNTQQLTDHLDEVIGFPLESEPDYDVLEPKFFDHFHTLAMAALEKQH